MNRITDVLRQHRETLRTSPTPQLDTELLVAHGLQIERVDLYREPKRSLSEIEMAQIDRLINARRAGRSIAQIIGRTEFYSIDLAINEHVLAPRADTEILVEKAIEIIGERPATVIDIGTGSGAIAIALAKHCNKAQVFALDLSDKALDIADHNMKRLSLPNLSMIRGDWLDALDNQCADMIVSNPPYIKSDDEHLATIGTKYEPRAALDGGNDGLQAYRRIIPTAIKVLKSDGVICLEHGYDQAESVSTLLRDNGLCDIEIVRDLNGHNRVCVGRLR